MQVVSRPIYRLFTLQRKPELGVTKPLTGLHVARGLGITRIDGHSRVAEDVTLGSSTMNYLLITANLVLLESSEQGLLHALDLFSAACDQAGNEISTKNVRDIMSLQNHKAV